MIAKAKVITHGSTAVGYSAEKELADIVKVNNLPEGIAPAAMWSLMMTLQEKHREKLNRHRPMVNTSIRIEVSPAEEETVGWTLDDWRKLTDEFIREFDSIDLSEMAKRKSAKSTKLQNSQYVVSLHRDSKSGILHLHINVNRIDMEGNVNDAHFIYERAMRAANTITARRGWVQAKTKRKWNIDRISQDCINALKRMKSFEWKEYERLLKEKGYKLVFKRDEKGQIRGYTVRSGNSVYKSSDLGHSRGLTPSRIANTWNRLNQEKIRQAQPPKPVTNATAKPAGTQTHRPEPSVVREAPRPMPVPKPAMVHLDIPVEYRTYPVDIPEEIYRIIMKEAEVPDPADCLWTKLADVQNTAILLFANMVDGATEIARNCGGGGSSASNDWGERPKDDKEWARECLRRARNLHTRTRGRGRRF